MRWRLISALYTSDFFNLVSQIVFRQAALIDIELVIGYLDLPPHS